MADKNVPYHSELVLAEPRSEIDWVRYFELRWRVLREPWQQPRGSEQDGREAGSIHLMLCDALRIPLAVGRLHLNSPHEAQIRFMAVDPTATGRGYGTAVLAALESRAADIGARIIVLNARTAAIPFYEKHGYIMTGEAETMFGNILHMLMTKRLIYHRLSS